MVSVFFIVRSKTSALIMAQRCSYRVVDSPSIRRRASIAGNLSKCAMTFLSQFHLVCSTETTLSWLVPIDLKVDRHTQRFCGEPPSAIPARYSVAIVTWAGVSVAFQKRSVLTGRLRM